MHHLQRVGEGRLTGLPDQHELFAVGQRPLGHEAAVLSCGGLAGQSQDGRPLQAGGHTQGLKPWGSGRVIGVRMCADDGLDAAPRRAPQPLDVRGIVRARIDHDVAAGRITHHVTVGARAGHEAWVGRGQALHVLEKLHRLFVLPVQAVRDLTIGTHQREFTKGSLVLHVT